MMSLAKKLKIYYNPYTHNTDVRPLAPLSPQGDSGDPMHIAEGGATVVAGVTSWGITSGGSCAPEFPSVYTRVSYFLDWLP